MKSGIFVHGFTLLTHTRFSEREPKNRGDWETIMWGDQGSLKKGRLCTAIELAGLVECTEIRVGGSGSYLVDGVAYPANHHSLSKNVSSLVSEAAFSREYAMNKLREGVWCKNQTLTDIGLDSRVAFSIDEESRTTIEELKNSLEYFSHSGVEHLHLVTSPSHAPRVCALLTWDELKLQRQLMPQISVVLAETDYADGDPSIVFETPMFQGYENEATIFSNWWHVSISTRKKLLAYIKNTLS